MGLGNNNPIASNSPMTMKVIMQSYLSLKEAHFWFCEMVAKNNNYLTQ
jgi:hypothetical protein